MDDRDSTFSNERLYKPQRDIVYAVCKFVNPDVSENDIRSFWNQISNQRKLSDINYVKLEPIKGLSLRSICALLKMIDMLSNNVTFKYNPKEIIQKRINSIDTLIECLDYYIDFSAEEKMMFLFLDQNMRVKQLKLAGFTDVSSCYYATKDFVRLVIDNSPSKIIVLHTHPNGEINPSNADIKATHSIVQIANKHNSDVLEHFIFSRDRNNLYFNTFLHPRKEYLSGKTLHEISAMPKKKIPPLT